MCAKRENVNIRFDIDSSKCKNNLALLLGAVFKNLLPTVGYFTSKTKLCSSDTLVYFRKKYNTICRPKSCICTNSIQ